MDYGLSADDVLAQLGDRREKFLGYQLIGSCQPTEADLTPVGWTPHLTTSEMGSGGRGPQGTQPFAFLDIFERESGYDESHGPKRIAILFLGADGVACYDAIYSQKSWKPPFVVVVQDHGFGNNYTQFGRGGLLEKVADRISAIPEYILVAENTAAWSAYEPVPGVDPVYGGRAQIPHVRRLFQRVANLHLNSPTTPESKDPHIDQPRASSATRRNMSTKAPDNEASVVALRTLEALNNASEAFNDHLRGTARARVVVD